MTSSGMSLDGSIRARTHSKGATTIEAQPRRHSCSRSQLRKRRSSCSAACVLTLAAPVTHYPDGGLMRPASISSCSVFGGMSASASDTTIQGAALECRSARFSCGALARTLGAEPRPLARFLCAQVSAISREPSVEPPSTTMIRDAGPGGSSSTPRRPAFWRGAALRCRQEPRNRSSASRTRRTGPPGRVLTGPGLKPDDVPPDNERRSPAHRRTISTQRSRR